MPRYYAWGSKLQPNYHRITILLGNGASIAVSPVLTTVLYWLTPTGQVCFTHDMNRLFQFFRTSDFEMILRLVWQASNVNRSLQIPDNRTHQAYLNVRNCLIQAVRDIHPEYEQVSDKLPICTSSSKGSIPFYRWITTCWSTGRWPMDSTSKMVIYSSWLFLVERHLRRCLVEISWYF